MKIAAITENGKTISQHFGRAPFYLVLTIENNQVTSREMRDKMGHAHFAGEPHSEEGTGQDPRGHGFDPAAQNRHAQMAAAIADCQVLLCGGMGAGAYESMKQAGIQPIVTVIPDIDEALTAYLSGQIIDHVERLH